MWYVAGCYESLILLTVICDLGFFGLGDEINQPHALFQYLGYQMIIFSIYTEAISQKHFESKQE